MSSPSSTHGRRHGFDLCASLLLALILLHGTTFTRAASAPRRMEPLGRGMVAVPIAPGQVFVGWRLLGTEPADLGFHLYRTTDETPEVRLTASPLERGTHFLDTSADLSRRLSYRVRPVKNGVEGTPGAPFVLPAGSVARPYLSLPLEMPPADTMPDGSTCTYSPNDASAGDLDGDGEYELVVKWDPSNSKDNSQSGHTGRVYLDAYRLDGRRLWRIDLGRNIRAGAHYTQFLVYDFDGNGLAEVVAKTADGAIDGLGRTIGDASRDHRNASGYVLSGPEYLSVFSGPTGAELDRVAYDPPRHPDTLAPSGAQLRALWGDDYGNRVDRFLACVAYLDGVRPSLVMCRGYYTRATLCAWDFRDGRLERRWLFDSDDGTPGQTAARGQGNHNLAVADVDGDGRDEILYGACAIDDDGRLLYATGLGHGDAMHVGDLDPDRPGLEVWSCHEDAANNGNTGLSLHDARTGELLVRVPATSDIGRGLALDIDPRHRGCEGWGALGSSLYSVKGAVIGPRPSSMNFGVWWDGDLLRELLDRTTIEKWDHLAGRAVRLLSADGAASNNGTKATPCLSADLLGDWREEVLLRSSDNRELRLYTTTIPSEHRFPTLMHDPVYRLSVAWQNVAYNQPPHPGYYLGEGMSPPPPPNITTELPPAAATDAHLTNLSVLAHVSPAAPRVLAGFVVSGTTPRRLLLRAVGPSLAHFGVEDPLTDPVLELYRGAERSHANQNWDGSPALAAAFAAVQAFALPVGSQDAALLVTLEPGAYTVQAYGPTGASGRVLIEVYTLP